MLIGAAGAQLRSVRVGSTMAAPPTAPGSRTFLSPNRKFKLVLEEATLPPISGPRTMTLNATIVEEVGNNIVTRWAASFDWEPVQFCSDGDLIVSDDGDFFVIMKRNGGDVLLCAKDFRRRLATSTMFTGINTGLFLTPPERLVASDVLDGQKGIRIWLRNEDNWVAFGLSDDAKNLVEPEIAALWHEATRDKVLDLMYANKREQLRVKVS